MGGQVCASREGACGCRQPYSYDVKDVIFQFLMILYSRKQSNDDFSEAQECECALPLHPRPHQLPPIIAALKACPCLSKHAPHLINWAFRCHNPLIAQPFSAFIRENCPQLIKPRVSSFYSEECFPDMAIMCQAARGEGNPEVLHIPPFPKDLCALLDGIFSAHGFIPNLERFLLFYPGYLEKHVLAETRLLEGERLDHKLAFFVAFAAAAERGSVYMMARYLRGFFRAGGDAEWLMEGRFPQRLQPILRLNRKMSHCVWEVNPETITDVLENEDFRWSANELALFVQIIAFAHNDATLALALGLLPEDTTLLQDFKMTQIVQLKAAYDENVYESSGQKLEGHEQMREAVELSQHGEGYTAKEESSQLALTRRELKKSMRRAEFIEPYMKEIGSELIHQQMYKQINAMLPLLEPFQSVQRRSHKNYPSLDYSEYNYKFMAYPILNNLTGSTADRLQALIERAQTMTRGNFGSLLIKQTRQFRKSVRYYGENLCGYTHQGYDYKNGLAAMLTMPVKFYIRLLMLSPLHITRQVLKEIQHEGGQIECFDLGHIAVLAATARMTLELTLAVQAIEL